jgi:tetratricopeptide (TPR) repeat protein
MTLGAYAYAVDDFDVAVDLDGTLAEAYVGRGKARYYLRAWQSALQDFDQALVLNPELADAYTGRGNMLSLLGEHVQALDALRQAVVLDETDPQKYVVLGDALLRGGAPDEAQLAYTTALSFEVRHVAAYVGRAMAWAELDDLSAAQADLTVALDIAPYDPVALNGQAWFNIWYLEEHSSDAERLAERAIAAAGSDLEKACYLHTLGWVYRHQGRYEEAIAALEEAARLATVEGKVVYQEIATHLEDVRASR